MPTTKRIFIPFTELSPDAREFNNEGLTQALNVAPMGDTYVLSRFWLPKTSALPGSGGVPPNGLHVHPSVSSSTWYGYFGLPAGKLYEASNTSTSPWTITDKTRLVGGAYSNSPWFGASFGDAVLMTNFADDPQLLTSPAAANFVKLAQSGGANPGMDPKAQFAFPVRNNMFLAYLNLSVGFDGLSAGDNPTVVAWSQTDNVRQYGSFNVTPQLTGTGYQPLNYDLGAITGGVGGQYALISMQRGWVRADGPPYTFRPISEGVGCQCPNSIIRFDNDVYFWGPNGPMVFRDGDGQAVPIARDKLSRTLTDYVFGGSYSAGIYTGATPYYTSVGADHVNRQVWWAFRSTQAEGDLILIYDVDTDRFSFQSPRQDGDETTLAGVMSLATRPEQLTGWAPGRDLVGILAIGFTGSGNYYLAVPYQSATSATAVFEKGYMQLDEDQTQRILRVRPIYSMSDNSILPNVTIEIRSKNKPFETPIVKTYTGTLDSHGWLTTPDTVFADFHRPKLTLSAIPSRITEISGIEVEIAFGGAYAA